MARQSASQHLAVLEAANLVSTVWQGREKLHYLNPVPLHEVQERWIDLFETPRLRVLSAVRHAAEEHPMTDRPTFVYVTYIPGSDEQQAGTPSRVTFTVEQHQEIVRLTVTHEDLPTDADREAVSVGWPA